MLRANDLSGFVARDLSDSVFFVEQAGTASGFRGVRETIEGHGLFASRIRGINFSCAYARVVSRIWRSSSESNSSNNNGSAQLKLNLSADLEIFSGAFMGRSEEHTSELQSR